MTDANSTLDYSLEVCKNHREISITNWFIRGSALGPIGGLSARQFDGCLPRREEKRRERRIRIQINEVMNPQHFGTDLADIRIQYGLIRISLEI